MTLGLTNGPLNVGITRTGGAGAYYFLPAAATYGNPIDNISHGFGTGNDIIGAYGITLDSQKSGIVCDMGTASISSKKIGGMFIKF